jgi:glycosyltransferase involved in cell wall biosynthesis
VRRPQLEALARRLGVGPFAHFLGHRTDVPAILRRADLGVLCSSAEGLSNAIIEGMASRLPMVVTDAGGNAELISHGVRGWVVPPRNPSALAEAIERILEHPEEAEQFGRAARDHVEAELTREQLVRSHAALYQRLAGAP